MKTSLSHLHSEFCNYQITFKNNTPRTIHWFKQVFKYFTQDTGATTVRDINLQTVSRYFVQGKCEKNWSAKTIKTRMSGLSLFFNWCILHKYLDSNPIALLPKPKLEKRIPKHISVDQAAYIMEWLKMNTFSSWYEKERALAIFSTFIYTGIRRSELINLKFSDVNFDEKFIFIRSGKGNKDRKIPMIPRLESYLSDYLKIRTKINDYSIYFFVSLKKRDSISYLVIKRLFLKIISSTGIHIHCHLLRHSYAVQMLEGGCDIFTLSKLMGHSDIKTTTIYLTATHAQKVRMAERHPLY